tara:strand:+ start:1488 stop:1610 length:123 start_codon:yes stop_codon:yes gene_type:complete
MIAIRKYLGFKLWSYFDYNFNDIGPASGQISTFILNIYCV